MMKEIDKIWKLHSMVEDSAEKEEILQAQQSLSAAFDVLLGIVPRYVLDTANTNTDSNASEGKKTLKEWIDDAEEALKVLNRYGSRYGMEFPIPESKREVAIYVVGYGREIMYSN